MNNYDFSLLDLDSTIHDLPGFDAVANPDEEGQAVLDVFNQQPGLPGILIMNGSQLYGFISRRMFFEHTGKRFGTEVYLRRPLRFLLKKELPRPLILPSVTKLSRAAQSILSRNELEVYEPIIESSDDHGYRIIHTLTLFTAQSQILITLHNQQVNKLSANLALDDDLAIQKFLKFAGIPSNVELERFKTTYLIHCPKCSQKVSYTIADVVRSYPTLQQGIEITDRMGSRIYLFYVRHTCGDQIIDLPVQHDHNLEYRSVKSPRLVENYV